VHVDGRGETQVGRLGRRLKVVEPAQHIMMPLGPEDDPGERRVDDFAGAMRAVQPVGAEELPAAPPGVADGFVCPTPCRPLRQGSGSSC
jgi:hypothetical protein